ncbi:MAG: ABC-ATPase domain-containing protein [Actinobacteria bacterium]|nr:ABC-ATPase domain-containing protein [Actinomycetota bacterium]
MDAAGLKQKLEQLDGGGYKAYRKIKGSYLFPRFTFFVDHVQSDPFAAPSRMRVRVLQSDAGFEPRLYCTDVRQTALEDYIARAFDSAISRYVKGHRGTGKSGLVTVDSGGQEILKRTAAVANESFVEVRFAVGLPASGRRCRGKDAAAILFGELPLLVDASLYFDGHAAAGLKAHVEAAEDQEWLRRQLPGLGLVAFVADGAILPRESGVSDRPRAADPVVGFQSPEQLRVGVDLPNGGRTCGMGIPEGVTLIVGGGYHGKSTLMNALERSVYCHIPGDGREGVVTRSDAVKIRAEDGRRVERVNISPFISNLPFGVDTVGFRTENASGSTSQAANIIEALEAGSQLLLIDEDTSASNFMIRDELMQRLIPKSSEPITPFIDRVRDLKKEHGVSTVLVMGGSGDYFEVADTVIAMKNYRPEIITAEARRVAASRQDVRKIEALKGFGALTARVPLAHGIDPRRGRREKVGARDLKTIHFGAQVVNLDGLEQLVDLSQTRAIGDLILYGLRRGYYDGQTDIKQILDRLLADVELGGLGIISPFAGASGAVTGPGPESGGEAGAPAAASPDEHPGDYALPRRFEIAAAFNRMRSLQVK